MKTAKNTKKSQSNFITNQQLLQGLRQKSTNKYKNTKLTGVNKSLIHNYNQELNQKSWQERNSKVNVSTKVPQNANMQYLKSNMSTISLLENQRRESFRNKKYRGSVENLRIQSYQNFKQKNKDSERVSLKQVKVQKIPEQIVHVILQLCNNTTNKQLITYAHQVINKYTHFSQPSGVLSRNQSVSSVPKVKQGQSSRGSLQKGLTKHQMQLLQKIEQLYKDKNNLKKQKKILQQKIDKLSQPLNHQKKCNLKQNIPTIINSTEINDSNLHKLIIQQSQVISKQALEHSQANEQLRRILYAQAQCLESKIKLIR